MCGTVCSHSCVGTGLTSKTKTFRLLSSYSLEQTLSVEVRVHFIHLACPGHPLPYLQSDSSHLNSGPVPPRQIKQKPAQVLRSASSFIQKIFLLTFLIYFTYPPVPLSSPPPAYRSYIPHHPLLLLLSVQAPSPASRLGEASQHGEWVPKNQLKHWGQVLIPLLGAPQTTLQKRSPTFRRSRLDPCGLPVSPEFVSSHEPRSAIFVSSLDPPGPSNSSSLQQDFQILAQSLAVDLCIFFHQLLDEGSL